MVNQAHGVGDDRTNVSELTRDGALESSTLPLNEGVSCCGRGGRSGLIVGVQGWLRSPGQIAL